MLQSPTGLAADRFVTMAGPSCLDLSYSEPLEDDRQPKPRFRLSPKCLKRMAKKSLKRLIEWLLEVEMGFVWGVAGLAIITFVFAAIWYIDPALLTLVLRFRKAECTTKNQAFLIGISNCSWTSCRLGCTREVYKCWQIQVSTLLLLFPYQVENFFNIQIHRRKVWYSIAKKFFVSVFHHYF